MTDIFDAHLFRSLPDDVRECDECGGSGQVDCHHCGGFPPCIYCGGVGVEACPECDGAGEVFR